MPLLRLKRPPIERRTAGSLLEEELNWELPDEESMELELLPSELDEPEPRPDEEPPVAEPAPEEPLEAPRLPEPLLEPMPELEEPEPLPELEPEDPEPEGEERLAELLPLVLLVPLVPP